MYGWVEAEISDEYVKTEANKTQTIYVARFFNVLDTVNEMMLTIVLLALIKNLIIVTFFTLTLTHKTCADIYEKREETSALVCFFGRKRACTVMSIDGIADRGVNCSRLRGYTLPVYWRNSYFSRKPSSLCLSSPEQNRASQNEIKPKMLSG